MTENNKEISPVISGIRFMEPAFHTQYSIVLHHDTFYNHKYGTEELVNYPYFRHYGIINTTAEKNNLPVNYQHTDLYDPLDFLESIHFEQDGWHWLLLTTTDSEEYNYLDTNYLITISIPENRKRNFEDCTEKYSHDQKIERYQKKLCQNYEKTIVPIIHVCSSTCKASFRKRSSSTNQFTNPPWCGVCAMQYFGDYMMKIINNGDNKLFITYRLGVKRNNLKWTITNVEIFDI